MVKELSKPCTMRIADAVKEYAKDDISGMAFWEQSEQERTHFRGASVNVDGVSIDPWLLDASQDDYLAFIVEHELAHLRLKHFIRPHKRQTSLEQEVDASAYAMNMLKNSGRLSESAIQELGNRWGKDLLNPNNSPLLLGLKHHVRVVMLRWSEVFRDYHLRKNHIWLNLTQGEYYTANYLASRGDIIAPDLRRLGFEVYLGEHMRVDLVFVSSENDFYLVEAKDAFTQRNVKNGAIQVKRYARALRLRFQREDTRYRKIVPVVAAIHYPNTTGYTIKREFTKKQIQSFLK